MTNDLLPPVPVSATGPTGTLSPRTPLVQVPLRSLNPLNDAPDSPVMAAAARAAGIAIAPSAETTTQVQAAHFRSELPPKTQRERQTGFKGSESPLSSANGLRSIHSSLDKDAAGAGTSTGVGVGAGADSTTSRARVSPIMKKAVDQWRQASQV